MDGSKGLPHNLEAERSVLGAILVQNDSLDEAREAGLLAEHFYLDSHKKIFEIACLLGDRRDPIDLVLLTSALKDRGWYDQIGGGKALTALFDDAFSVGNVSKYSRVVRDKAIQRKMIEACTGIVAVAYSGVEDTEEFLHQAETDVFAVADIRLEDSMHQLKGILLSNMKAIEELALRKEEITGLATGFRAFDRMTTGLHPGQVVIVAARPGMGKTSWILSAIQNAAVKEQKVCAIFSLEMAKEEIGFKLLSGMARIDSKNLKIGRLEDQDWHNLSQAADDLAKSRIFIDDSGAISVMDIRARCRRLLSRESKLDLIVIDYLQLMKGTSKSKGESSREREIAEISRGLKELSKELKVPIIALSQLNRGVESRQDKRPSLADLRESGAIEQDADMVLFIHREDYYDRDAETKGTAEIIIAKNRSGEPGTVHLAWVPQFTLFANLADNSPSGSHVGGRGSERGDITL